MKISFSLEVESAPQRRRRPTRASLEAIAADRALRAKLEARPGPGVSMSVAAGDPPPGARIGDGWQEWAVASDSGELLDFGRIMWFGPHHTLTIAIGAAVKEAHRAATARMLSGLDVGAVAPQLAVPRLTVRTHDRGFGPVNYVGIAGDNGRGGRTRKVAESALRAGVLLAVLWVPDEEPLPADRMRDAWSHIDCEARAAERKAKELERAAEAAARTAWAGDLPL